MCLDQYNLQDINKFAAGVNKKKKNRMETNKLNREKEKDKKNIQNS